eukprot:m.4820 g.4820  ORF g.4820 m.4820 type:complete len:1110 (-) comp2126_c0_seq2:116-3445(-)
MVVARPGRSGGIMPTAPALLLLLLVPLSLLEVTDAVKACGQKGVCKCIKETYVVDCTGLGLDKLPRLPLTTKELLFQGNKLKRFNADRIAHLSDLRVVDLRDNAIVSYRLTPTLAVEHLLTDGNPVRCTEWETTRSCSCKAGTELLGTECKPCRAGTMDHDRDSATRCEECRRGNYQPAVGATFCIPCDEGWYQDSPGGAVCIQCEQRACVRDGRLFSCGGAINNCAERQTGILATEEPTVVINKDPSTLGPLAIGLLVVVVCVVIAVGFKLYFWRKRMSGPANISGPTQQSSFIAFKPAKQAAQTRQRLLGPSGSVLSEIQSNRLERHGVLGEGFFAVVAHGSLREPGKRKVQVAIKTLRKVDDAELAAGLQAEAEKLCSIDHPNVIKAYGVVLSGFSVSSLVMELASCNLKEWMDVRSAQGETATSIGVHRLLDFCVQICRGLSAIADKGIVHRDIAARNMLVTSDSVIKVSDFGLARNVGSSNVYKLKSTRKLPARWMAPESLDYGMFTPESDIWSFAVCAWEIFTLGMLPYIELPNRDIAGAIREGYRLAIPEDCPLALYDAMQLCWVPDPSDRPSCDVLIRHMTALMMVRPGDFAEDSAQSQSFPVVVRQSTLGSLSSTRRSVDDIRRGASVRSNHSQMSATSATSAGSAASFNLMRCDTDDGRMQMYQPRPQSELESLHEDAMPELLSEIDGEYTVLQRDLLTGVFSTPTAPCPAIGTMSFHALHITRPTATVMVQILGYLPPEEHKYVRQEINALAQLKHKNVLGLVGMVRTVPALIVTEGVGIGDLRTIIVDSQVLQCPMLFVERLSCMSQIAAGMQHLASRGFVHRDLRAASCFMCPGNVVKVANFWRSRKLKGKPHKAKFETLKSTDVPFNAWMAPEVITLGSYSSQSDVYSFGVTCWELIMDGAEPFLNQSKVQVVKNACQGKTLQCPDTCPSDVARLVHMCLHAEREERPSFSSLAYNLGQSHQRWSRSMRAQRDFFSDFAQRQSRRWADQSSQRVLPETQPWLYPNITSSTEAAEALKLLSDDSPGVFLVYPHPEMKELFLLCVVNIKLEMDTLEINVAARPDVTLNGIPCLNCHSLRELIDRLRAGRGPVKMLLK